MKIMIKNKIKRNHKRRRMPVTGSLKTKRDRLSPVSLHVYEFFIGDRQLLSRFLLGNLDSRYADRLDLHPSMLLTMPSVTT